VAGVRHRIDADATFDGDRDLHGLAHRGHAFCDERWLTHQARAEATALHAIARAAAIQIDLVIAELCSRARGAG
jgi:hypothetical protein